MQAWLCENPTGVEALQWKELPTPEPKAGEVRIAIRAASLNFPDLLIVQNKYQMKPPLPFVPGSEYAGTVEAVGDGVKHLKVGDAVAAFGGTGGFGTHAIVNAGLQSGKLVCGHARGLEGADLNAFMAAGVSSDHELTSGTDLLSKLSAGMMIELRGSHDHLLKQFVEVINDLGFMPQTVTLCTDDVFPDELYFDGGLDDVVRRLVRDGLKPEWALRAATLNAAMRLGRNDLGLIAAGRRADIVLFEDLQAFKAKQVIASGKIVAEAGKITDAFT